MDNDIKLLEFYDGDKLRSSIMKMEQFWKLSQDKTLDDKNRICAKKMFEHFRRLSMCLLMKEMPDNLDIDLIINKEYMENLYKKYQR